MSLVVPTFEESEEYMRTGWFLFIQPIFTKFWSRRVIDILICMGPAV